MELEIRLSERDYLSYQLFAASQSVLIKKRRKIEWILSSSFFVLLGLIFLMTGIMLLCYYFLAVGLLSFLFFPYYSRRRYKKHYLKSIRDVYRNNFGKVVSVVFTDEQIETSDNNSEAKIKYNEIKEIHEIGSHFFVHFLSGTALIIPKSFCSDVHVVKQYFEKLAEKYNIKYNLMIDWTWK